MDVNVLGEVRRRIEKRRLEMYEQRRPPRELSRMDAMLCWVEAHHLAHNAETGPAGSTPPVG